MTTQSPAIPSTCQITLFNYTPYKLLVGNSFKTSKGLIGGVLAPVVIDSNTSYNFPYNNTSHTFSFANKDVIITHKTYTEYAPISVCVSAFNSSCSSANPSVSLSSTYSSSILINYCGLYIITSNLLL